MTEPSALRTDLDWAFTARRRSIRQRQVAAALVSTAVLGGALLYRLAHPHTVVSRYQVATVTVGDIVDRVRANGTLEPTLEVKVSAQASGRVASVLVDFNSEVKKGDVLAELDPSIANTQVEEQRADLRAQEAQLERAESDADNARIALERVQRIFAGAASTQMELDNARGSYEGARAAASASRASVAAPRAQLSVAQTNVLHTKIYAPVDGVVVERNVDPGASVVANFQAETLFVIAQDLRTMRIVADVDEADVSKVSPGMPVSAKGDAYPSDLFHGTLRQIRYGSHNQQGVVTYPAVIDLANDQGKLRPGMTAVETFDAREARGVRRVANAALRFRPAFATHEAPTAMPADDGTLWLLTSARDRPEVVEAVSVHLGITDGSNTELVGASPDPGIQVVIDDVEAQP